MSGLIGNVICNLTLRLNERYAQSKKLVAGGGTPMRKINRRLTT
jgi:hypothetical protein